MRGQALSPSFAMSLADTAGHFWSQAGVWRCKEGHSGHQARPSEAGQPPGSQPTLTVHMSEPERPLLPLWDSVSSSVKERLGWMLTAAGSH